MYAQLNQPHHGCIYKRSKSTINDLDHPSVVGAIFGAVLFKWVFASLLPAEVRSYTNAFKDIYKNNIDHITVAKYLCFYIDTEHEISSDKLYSVYLWNVGFSGYFSF